MLEDGAVAVFIPVTPLHPASQGATPAAATVADGAAHDALDATKDTT